MKKQNWKSVLLIGLAAVLVFGTVAAAAELVPGVTVAKDESSPTGYTVTFVYENAAARKVEVVGSFVFYKEGGKYGAIPEESYSPFEYEPGMFRADLNDLPAMVPMTKAEGTNLWTAAIPMPSGHHFYNYKVDGTDVTMPDPANIPDPANPPMVSTAQTGNASPLSTFDVPYDPRQGSSVDFSFLMPRTDGKSGKLVFDDYTNIDGDLAPLAIYLPYGYDVNRAEGYKTLYLAHGTGANELEWFAKGNTHYIFDNLTADGSVEPTIVVTMMNSKWRDIPFNFAYIDENVMKHIIPFMESNYNVSTEPAGRAFGGLSFGSRTTGSMYAAYPDQFGYFGCFSGADPSVYIDPAKLEKLSLPVVMTGNGIYENRQAIELTSQLKELGISYDEYIVKGAHCWPTWEILLEIFATDYLWK